MSCASRTALAALVAALAAAGCKGPPGAAPRPASVEPGWGDSTAATPIVIRGDRFTPKAIQDLGGAAGDRADGGFSARLGDAALLDVRWVDAHTLTAVVPAGLPGGTRDLLVRDAEGRTGGRAAAFLVGVPSVVLAQEGALSSSAVSVGQQVVLSVSVRNDGNHLTAAVLPEVTVSGAGGLALAGAALARDLAPGATSTFTFRYGATAAGAVSLAVATKVTGPLGGEVEAAPALVLPLRVDAPAALAAAVSVSRETATVGQGVTVTLTVQNLGEAAALAVAPTSLGAAGAGALGPLTGPEPATAASIPGGGSATFRWTGAAAASGAVTFTAGASGRDAHSDLLIDAAAASSPELLVQLPPVLEATLSIPPAFAPGPFEATLTIHNRGEATAAGVSAAALTVVAGSTSTAAELGAFPAVGDVPGGGSRSVEALWSASAGQLTLSGTAAGQDANTGAPVETGPARSDAAIVGVEAEVTLLEADALGDGSPFAFVNAWQGRLLVGPNGTARTFAQLDPDAGGQGTVGLALPKDVNGAGKESRNGLSGAPPFPSLGSAACSAGNRSACGPDLENARGLVKVETWGGAPWLLAGGARTQGELRYVYATPDGAAPISFRYVDLSRVLDSDHDRVALTAARGLDGLLYLGFGGHSAQLVQLVTRPAVAGLDANSGDDATDLDFASLPRLGPAGSPSNRAAVVVIDLVERFGGQLFLANNGGFARSKAYPPRPYGSHPEDWADATPSAPAFGARTAVTVSSAANLTPRDRAVPAAVEWDGRLFAIRNTTAGPQLWACSPLIGGDAATCDPGDWLLYSPNTSGDALLTQANDAGNVRAGLLVATAAWLYLGLENAAGVQLYRTATATPVNISDFRGKGGCIAGAAGCEGFGGDGLGTPAFAKRFLDAKALFTGADAGLYFTAGNGTDPARLYRVLD